jgi:uncharacterized protein
MSKPYQNLSHVPKTASGSPGSAAIVRRRLQTKRSGIHGKGVYATVALTVGERLLEYTGERISWAEALRRHPHDPAQPQHTFYFHVDDTTVIDGKVGGNSSRWINHSCAPNCTAVQEGQRVFIEALRNVSAGEELFFDYGLVTDEPLTDALKADYPCWCGHGGCRGTLLAPSPNPAVSAQPRKKRQQVSQKRTHKQRSSAQALATPASHAAEAAPVRRKG